jgi:cholesterol oxidase
MTNKNQKEKYDYIIIGSGFGGSVSALRLVEKGYSVLLIEKGKWYGKDDFPKTNWNLKKWTWLPSFGFYGIMKMTFYAHIGILSGTGVGGGSLVYANTLPKPKANFYKNGTWANLTDWESELAPHYKTASTMLGSAVNPVLETGDMLLKDLAAKRGQSNKFEPTEVSVFFGESDVEVDDPFFNGEGPRRTGCTYCGACMTGCKHNAKNSLDKNYLYLAQKKGLEIIAEQEVYDVITDGASDGSKGYIIKSKDSTRLFKSKYTYKADNVIFAGGVLGNMNLLIKLKRKSLPNLSNKLGKHVLTNNEALIFSVSEDKDKDLSQGVAIGSILDVDDKTHLEVVRYGEGSGFWRTLVVPNVVGGNMIIRIVNMFISFFKSPWKYIKLAFVKDFAKQSIVLLFMQQIDTTLSFKKGLFRLKTRVDSGSKPSAQIPLAFELAKQYSELNNAKPMVLMSETLFNMPSTAHILGGAVMGANANEGVIDKNNMVFGYKNMMICDGSMISANPGVNPSLSIAAITERAMSYIKVKTG